MEKFLNFYLDSNVKYRQLARVTNKLIDSVRSNESLNFPIEFYQNYGQYLESYQVDSQTLVSLWKDVNKLLIDSKTSNPSLLKKSTNKALYT